MVALINQTPVNCPLANVRSLAECAYEAQQAMSAVVKDEDGDIELAAMYDRMHEKYLGYRPYRAAGKNPKTIRAMIQVVQFCEENDLDLALFIAAQMECLAGFCKRRRMGFQPAMLGTGEKAMARYNYFVSKTGREFHRAKEDVLMSPETKLRDAVFEGEVSVGAYFCAAALTGSPATWEESIIASRPSDEWMAFELGISAPTLNARLLFADFQFKHTADRIAKIRNYARLTAAVSVADRYRYGLSEYLGLTGRFTWAALAGMLVRVLGPLHRRPVPKAVPGIAWGAFNLNAIS